MEIKGDKVILSTGKELYANRGTLGISPKGEDGWEITEGYDGSLWAEWYEGLSKGELIEIAEYMKGLWIEFGREMEKRDE